MTLTLYTGTRTGPVLLTVRCYGYPPRELTPAERAGNTAYEAHRTLEGTMQLAA